MQSFPLPEKFVTTAAFISSDDIRYLGSTFGVLGTQSIPESAWEGGWDCPLGMCSAIFLNILPRNKLCFFSFPC